MMQMRPTFGHTTAPERHFSSRRSAGSEISAGGGGRRRIGGHRGISGRCRKQPVRRSQFLLIHSVGNYPQNDEIDVATNYADYHDVEALLRCAALG
jgi:hypothetical protein